jgi:PKD repeat protein
MKLKRYLLNFLYGVILIFPIILLPGCKQQADSQNQFPTASFTINPENGRAPLTVSFDGSASLDPDGTISAYHWDFGDNQTSTDNPASHVFQNIGTYTVQLTVTDNQGANASSNGTLTVLPTDSRRPWPDTSSGIHVFFDQIRDQFNDAQVRFCAGHYAGCQKMTRSAADRLRAINPDFLILHYRLGNGLGYRIAEGNCQPSGDLIRIIEGNDWVVEWPGNDQLNEAWFFHWPESSNTRVYQCDWGWYLMEIGHSGWRQYWKTEVLRQLAANDNDGLFMDSISVPNYISYNGFNPPLPAIDENFENAWADRIYQWLQWLKNNIGDYYIVVNAGGWINNRDDTDYSPADGIMIEGFVEEVEQSPIAFADWQLQMNRILDAVQRNQAIIAQSYVSGNQDRMYVVGCYLLFKHHQSYVNIQFDMDAEWWPEYDIPIGKPSADPVLEINELDIDGDFIYQRQFENGLVLVNPTNPWDGSAVTRTIQLNTTRYLATGNGGGNLPENAVPTGTLTYQAVTQVILPPFTAAILLNSNPLARYPLRSESNQ